MTKTNKTNRQPLWKITKRMRDLKLELELLKTDPSTNHEEIVKVDAELSSLKVEYAKRRAELKRTRNKKKKEGVS